MGTVLDEKIITTWFKKQFSIRNPFLFCISFKDFLDHLQYIQKTYLKTVKTVRIFVTNVPKYS